jgi:release factor glutamine methyltransferase
MHIHEALRQARQSLQAVGISADDAARDAEWLARHALALDRASLLAQLRDPWPEPESYGVFTQLVARRCAREPMAYLIGEHDFFGRTFEVGPGVLIPRPETELLIEEALRRLPPGQNSRVVDIGTGSGCLAITIACERPRAHVAATDISTDALQRAARNAVRHQAVVSWHHGALFAGATGLWDLIVSNPPYIADGDRATLMPDVVRYEPSQALFAGPEGLDVIRDLIAGAPAALTETGVLLMEIGAGQDTAVARLVHAQPTLRLEEIRPDAQGIPRMVIAARTA